MTGRPFLPMLMPGATGGVVRFANNRGQFRTSTPFTPSVVQRLPTDTIGSVFLTITGIRPNTEVYVVSIDKAVLAFNEDVTGQIKFKLDRYASGSANNTVRILIVNKFYEVIDITYELGATDGTIPVFQRIDRNYSNPD